MDAKVSSLLCSTAMIAVLGMAGNRNVYAQAPACTGFSSSVTIQISTSGETAKVEPDRACVDTGGKVNWTAADGETWKTDFADDDHSAFKPGHMHYRGKVHKAIGARVRACSTSDPRFNEAAGGCVFKYTATHVKGGKTSTIDPDIVIKPGSK